jgi:orotate phosphoribosyltransferase
VIAARTEALFRHAGAVREGHVRLETGRHADSSVETYAVLADPAATGELCGFWAAEYEGDHGPAVDVVVGPTPGGAILAFDTARQLGVRAAFADEGRAFRRGRSITPGERVLLVDDVLATRGSLLVMIEAVEAMGGEIQGCHVLVDDSGEDRAVVVSPTTGRAYPLHALWRLRLPTWEPGPDTCPRCAANEPLDEPGSTEASPTPST